MKHSKTLLALVLCLCALVLVSCGSNKLVGTWTGSESAMGVSVETQFTFNEDGTGKLGTMGVNVDFTYTASDGKLFITTEVFGVSDTTEYTYEIKGDTLTLNGETVLTKQK